MKFILAFAILFGAITPSLAADPSWEADKLRLQSINKLPSDAEKCQETWNILWPWAKKGQIEARKALLLDMAMNYRKLPGRSGDAISRVRDATIIAVHSIEDEEDETTESFLQAVKQLEHISGRQEFLDCIEHNLSPECTRVAVNKGLVPAFEDFASEIDTLSAAGGRSTCVYAN